MVKIDNSNQAITNLVYAIIVTKNPFGREVFEEIKPASSYILNSKLYTDKKAAEDALDEFQRTHSYKYLISQFSVEEDIFLGIRDFVINYGYANYNGKVVKNSFQRNELIDTYCSMFSIKYDVENFDKDEEAYHKLYEDEPIAKLIELNL